MYKKAQIKMMETIAVLIVFIIIAILSGSFYYGYVTTNDIQSNIDKINDDRMIQLMEQISNMPEFICTNEDVETSNCFDLYKLSAANKTINDNWKFYQQIFGNVEIYIETIHPDFGTIVLYNKSDKNRVNIKSSKLPILIFNSTARESRGDYSFAILNIKRRI